MSKFDFTQLLIFGAKTEAMIKLFKQFAADETGATAIEYGLIVALIAVVIITAVSSLGTNLNTKFKAVSNSI